MSVGNGADSVFQVTISGTTFSPVVDLGAAWKTVYLRVPTMTSGTEIYLQTVQNASSTVTSGFRIMHPPVNTSAAQVHTFSIASSVSQRVIPVPPGFRYMAIEYSSLVTSVGQTFYFYCGN